MDDGLGAAHLRPDPRDVMHSRPSVAPRTVSAGVSNQRMTVGTPVISINRDTNSERLHIPGRRIPQTWVRSLSSVPINGSARRRYAPQEMTTGVERFQHLVCCRLSIIREFEKPLRGVQTPGGQAQAWTSKISLAAEVGSCPSASGWPETTGS